MSNTIKAPIAAKKPHVLEKFKDVRIDDYFWLNDRENPEVIEYLNQENDYYQQMTVSTKSLQEALFLEMKARIKEDDQSVPYFYNGYFYCTRFETGQNYPIYSRRKELVTAKEEILFDCNQLAEGKAYFNLGGFSISPNNNLAIFSFDTTGRRIYTMQIKDLETNEILSDCIENVTDSAVWANDNQTIFYTSQDPETLRADKVFKHKLGAKQTDDVLVYFEKDDTFTVDISKSKSRKYLAIESSSTLTTEYQILNADTPDKKFTIFQKRKRGVEYSINHYKNHFYIVTNSNEAFNFKIMKTPENATTADNWQEVIAHREDVLIEDVEIFADYLVLEERCNGLNQIHILPTNGQESYYLPFDSETYTAFTSTNIDFETEVLRYSYQSLKTPASTIDFNMRTKEKEVKKEQQVLGSSFDKNNYTEKRLWATAADGVKIPISIIYKTSLKQASGNPLLQYAYGSYGYSMEASFSSTRLSLLDRGFIYAIAHVRGGEDLGRQWYEDGKLLNKKNTFTDFIACSKYLIENKITTANHLYAEGGSAGGLLMGVIANIAPQLYKGIIAQVPFVDVVTTMLDATIPLTTGEYDEWGNPNKKKYYDYIKSYSPYDNVVPQNYPNMYVSTGLHDSQVQYWEPAKWVAKLRANTISDSLLFLDTNMKAGHGGASGRFEALKELSKEFSFLLHLEGIEK